VARLAPERGNGVLWHHAASTCECRLSDWTRPTPYRTRKGSAG